MTANPIRIRSYQAHDLPDVLSLSLEGVLSRNRQIDPTTLDFEDMGAAYFSRPEDHFWVAETAEGLIGMIGVAKLGRHIQTIRRLRVRHTWQETDLVFWLVKVALDYCRHHGVLKVILDAPCRPRRAVWFLRRLGFQYARTHGRDNRDVMEFYLNLYESPSADKGQMPDHITVELTEHIRGQPTPKPKRGADPPRAHLPVPPEDDADAPVQP